MKHDYIKAAQELDLFSIKEHSPGFIWWHPNGLALLNSLKQAVKEVHEDFNYEEVKTPNIASSKLFEISGHLEKFKQNMFLIPFKDQMDYVVRPMSRPNHIQVYDASNKSYNQLPLKYFEFGEVVRNEASGALQTLFRMRGFCQDDSHVFSSKEGMESVLADFIKMSKLLYEKLGFSEISYQISLRPQERYGDDALWDEAENALRQACLSNGISNWVEEEGGGAFYGPKLELHLKDKLGRSWQCGTIQVDYVLPERFDLKYLSRENKLERPVILHHAVLGSLERFIGILLENYGVDLPFNLSPVQVVVVNVKEDALDYAKEVASLLKKKGIRVKLLDKNENLNNKVKQAQSLHPKQILVLGQKEVQDRVINVRGEKEKIALKDYLESFGQ